MMKHPPKCSGCATPLHEATPKVNGEPYHVGYLPCPTCPPGTRVVYYLQIDRDGHKAGWPMCTRLWCTDPVVDGQTVCQRHVGHHPTKKL